MSESMAATWSTTPAPARVAIAVLAAVVLFLGAFALSRGDGKPRYGAPLTAAPAGAAAPAIPSLGHAAAVPAMVKKKRPKRRRRSSPSVSAAPANSAPATPAPAAPQQSTPTAPQTSTPTPTAPKPNPPSGGGGGHEPETIIVG
jgi:hypothetical protein